MQKAHAAEAVKDFCFVVDVAQGSPLQLLPIKVAKSGLPILLIRKGCLSFSQASSSSGGEQASSDTVVDEEEGSRQAKGKHNPDANNKQYDQPLKKR